MKQRPSKEDLRQAIEAQLQLRLETLPPIDQDWNDLGLDSLEVIDILLKVEDALGQTVPVEKFGLEMTTASLVDFLDAQMASRNA